MVVDSNMVAVDSTQVVEKETKDHTDLPTKILTIHIATTRVTSKMEVEVADVSNEVVVNKEEAEEETVAV